LVGFENLWRRAEGIPHSIHILKHASVVASAVSFDWEEAGARTVKLGESKISCRDKWYTNSLKELSIS
jgi:hypothetical protein